LIALPKVVDHQNALTVRDQGLLALQQESISVDAQALVEFDTSILAILLAWFRAKHSLEVLNAPEKLRVLSRVYGLDELFILKKA